MIDDAPFEPPGWLDCPHRTRRTHTLEVTQMSRITARRLGVKEDPTEAIRGQHEILTA